MGVEYRAREFIIFGLNEESIANDMNIIAHKPANALIEMLR